jgi:hypothetical protein
MQAVGAKSGAVFRAQKRADGMSCEEDAVSPERLRTYRMEVERSVQHPEQFSFPRQTDRRCVVISPALDEYPEWADLFKEGGQVEAESPR